MASQLINYQCPSCDGPLHFDAKTGKLKCDYCRSLFDPEEIEQIYSEREQKARAAFEEEMTSKKTAGAKNWQQISSGEWGNEAEDLMLYSCPSCGAELVCSKTAGTVSCPYCGNNGVIPGQLGGMLRPDYIIPFKIQKEKAVEILKQHCSDKKLLPKAFKTDNHIEEVKGVYVPFWLFNGTADVDIYGTATSSNTYTSGDEEITSTKHFEVRRAGRVGFKRVPVDGSKEMPDAYMESIEPFDYSKLVEFKTSYLPGFMANKYDVSVEECAARADERCKATAVEQMERDASAGYDSFSIGTQTVVLERGEVEYALLPVWLLSTKWKDRTFLFAINGQSGKAVGNLPMSVGLYVLLLFKTLIISSLLIGLISTIIFSSPIGGWLFG